MSAEANRQSNNGKKCKDSQRYNANDFGYAVHEPPPSNLGKKNTLPISTLTPYLPFIKRRKKLPNLPKQMGGSGTLERSVLAATIDGMPKRHCAALAGLGIIGADAERHGAFHDDHTAVIEKIKERDARPHFLDRKLDRLPPVADGNGAVVAIEENLQVLPEELSDRVKPIVQMLHLGGELTIRSVTASRRWTRSMVFCVELFHLSDEYHLDHE